MDQNVKLDFRQITGLTLAVAGRSKGVTVREPFNGRLYNICLLHFYGANSLFCGQKGAHETNAVYKIPRATQGNLKTELEKHIIEFFKNSLGQSLDSLVVDFSEFVEFSEIIDLFGQMRRECLCPDELDQDGLCPCEACSIYNTAPQCYECEREHCTCADWRLRYLTNCQAQAM